MSEYNFYDTLRGFANGNPLRLCMPGHKGKALPMPEWNAVARLDFTELTPTGNLYGDGDDWLEEAQRLWAWDWCMDAAFFATAGSTQGNLTLLRLFTTQGDTVLVDRVSHKSIHHGLALFDLRPVWLEREWDSRSAVTGALTPDALERAFADHPEAKAVVVTSPTFYGVLSDLDALAEVCHAHGAKLLVDGAHGAHLPLVLDRPKNCLIGHNPYKNCDGVTVSTHKTLPAPGQTAVILANGVGIADLRRASALTSTTSPSFPMMAALDRLRAWMHEDEARTAYRACAQAVALLREIYPSLPRSDLDPCRFTLQVPNGYALAQKLEELGVYVEMADVYHAVCIFTHADGQESFARFCAALDALEVLTLPSCVPELDAPPLPEQAITPREAEFAAKAERPLLYAEGRICADCVAPYPPGVPVIAPGERVDKKTLAYLGDLCYDVNSSIMTVAE